MMYERVVNQLLSTVLCQFFGRPKFAVKNLELNRGGQDLLVRPESVRTSAKPMVTDFFLVLGSAGRREAVFVLWLGS